MKKELDVVAAIIIKDGKVLSTRRGGKSTLEGYWEFPGGKIEEGESPRQALRREIQEEIDLNVNPADNVYMKNTYEYDFAIVNLTTYICHLDKGEPTLREHTDYRWLKREDLSEVNWAPADVAVVDKLAEFWLDE